MEEEIKGGCARPTGGPVGEETLPQEAKDRQITLQEAKKDDTGWQKGT